MLRKRIDTVQEFRAYLEELTLAQLEDYRHNLLVAGFEPNSKMMSELKTKIMAKRYDEERLAKREAELEDAIGEWLA